MFNWSLPYYLAEPFISAGFSLTNSFKIVLAVSVIVSFFTMLLFLKQWLPKQAALLGAFLYVWTPYRFNIMYLRGALGEATAFMFWPLIFMAVLVSFRKHYMKSVILASFSFTLLLLSHQVMFLMILPVWLSFVILLVAVQRNLRGFLASLTGLALGLALSAFFWIPAFIESKFLMISSLTSYYKFYLMPIVGLLTQPGYFTPDIGEFFANYGLGWPQLVILAVALCTSFLLLLQAKRWHNQKEFFLLGALILFTGFSLLALFLLLPQSEFLWQRIPLLSSFLYPQRFLGLATFTVSILAGILASIIRKFQSLGWVVAITAVVILNYPALFPTTARTNNPDTYYYASNSTTDMTGEFLPRWVDKRFYFHPDDLIFPDAIRIESGSARITNVVTNTASIRFSVVVQAPATFRMHQFYFPGWRIKANGLLVPVKPGENGVMLFQLPPGNYEVVARLENTQLRTLSTLLTIVSVIAVIFVFAKIKLSVLRQKLLIY